VPGLASSLRWPSGAIRLPASFYGVVLALRKAGIHAGFHPLTPHVAQGSFARAAYYHRRHYYYNPMRQSLAPPHTSRLFTGYSAGLTDETPSLRCIPDLATVPPPLRRRALQRHLPDPSLEILPSPFLHRLGALNTRNCLRAGSVIDAAAIPLCCGPVARSPSWAVPSYDGEDFILGAFIEAVTQPRCPIRYAAVRLLPRPIPPRLV
jgi:hypothetical protein